MGSEIRNELNIIAEKFRQHFVDARVEEIFYFPRYAEEKWDGEFVVIFSDGKHIQIANRHKTVYDPTTFEKAGLPSGVYVLIAERISLRGDLYCYLTDRAITNCPTLALRIHGLVSYGNTDCTQMSYEERWKLLREFFYDPRGEKLLQQDEHVQLVDHRLVNSQHELQIYYDECRAQGREGVVVKSLEGLLADGYKIKPKITLDVAVLGIKKSKKWKEKNIPNSFVLGIFENGIWKRFGESSSGLTDSERDKIGKEVIANKTGEDRHYIFCKPTVIIEIMFQEQKEKGFRHPRIIRIRDDKTVDKATPASEVKQQLKQEPERKKKMTLASWDMKQTAVQRFLSDYDESA